MDLFKAEQVEGAPENWTLNVFYRCKSDPRWIVPLRNANAAWTPSIDS